MRFEYLIGMRYLRARRRERFVSLIAIISLAGVTLGTFALTVALSVMSEMIRSFTPPPSRRGSRDGAAPAMAARRCRAVPVGVTASSAWYGCLRVVDCRGAQSIHRPRLLSGLAVLHAKHH